MGTPSKVAPAIRFGRLTVLADTGRRKWGQIVWRCRCACGREVAVVSANLSKGLTTSCGCYRTELTRERNRRTRRALRLEIISLATTHGIHVDLPEGEITRHTRVRVMCPVCREWRATDVAGVLRYPLACRHCGNRISVEDLREQLRPRMVAVDRPEYDDPKHHQGRAYCQCQVCQHRFSRTVGELLSGNRGCPGCLNAQERDVRIILVHNLGGAFAIRSGPGGCKVRSWTAGTRR